MGNGAIYEKSMDFAVKVVELSRYLRKRGVEEELVKQLLRSATSIGANVREGRYAQSRRDFAAKMSIALNEAAETEYWLELMMRTKTLTREEYEGVGQDCGEVAKLLTAIVKSAKESREGKC